MGSLNNISELIKTYGLCKWYHGTYEKYLALTDKDPNGMYFITDKHLILRGENLFGSACEFYKHNERPFKGGRDKLYIDDETLVAYTWNEDKSEWIQIFDDFNTAEDLNSTATGVMTKKITDDLIKASFVNAITDIIYDPDSRQLKYMKNNTLVDIVTLPVGAFMKFDVSTRELQMLDIDGNIVSSTVIPDRYIIGGKYNDEVKAIVFNMSDGTQVKLKAFDLLRLYNGTKTPTATFHVDNYIDGRNIVYVDINISTEDTKITIEDDGLYVAKIKDTVFADKLANANGGEVLAADEEGNVSDSGYILTSGLSNSLATEEFVNNLLNSVKTDVTTENDNYAKVEDLVTEKELVERLNLDIIKDEEVEELGEIES